MNDLMMNIDFTVLTTERRLYDIHYAREEEDFYDKLFEEQQEILKANGIDYNETVCGVHSIRGWWQTEKRKCWKDTLNEAVQGLAIKDGVDLVRFTNGNLGYVGYYNGHMDALEIIHVFNS